MKKLVIIYLIILLTISLIANGILLSIFYITNSRFERAKNILRAEESCITKYTEEVYVVPPSYPSICLDACQPYTDAKVNFLSCSDKVWEGNRDFIKEIYPEYPESPEEFFNK